MAQTNYTPISLYYSTTAAAVPTAANLVQGELAINTADGKLYYEDSSGVVQTLASKAGALGDVVGPATATDNALARFDLTTGKLIQNSVGILSDAGVLTGLTGLTSSGSITLSSLTSGRVTYAGASGLLTDSANLTYGTGLSVNGISQVFQTGLFSTDGTLSNYSVNNGVYLNGNATGWSQLSGDGTRATFVRVWGSGASPANFIVLNTAGSERMRVDSSGNVGIGTSSPSYNLSVAGNTASEIAVQVVNSNIGNTGYRMANSLRSWAMFVNDSDSGALRFYDYTASAERMRIDSSGNLLVGGTSQIGKISGYFDGATVSGVGLQTSKATTGSNFIVFNNSAGATAGYINHDGTTTVSYVTSSDYRLKENITPISNALAKVAQLKPVTYTWKNTNNEQGEGFIAHELAEVCPLAVCGEKDDVNEDGSIKAQGIDSSKIIGLLTAAIQELKAEFDAYKATHP